MGEIPTVFFSFNCPIQFQRDITLNRYALFFLSINLGRIFLEKILTHMTWFEFWVRLRQYLWDILVELKKFTNCQLFSLIMILALIHLHLIFEISSLKIQVQIQQGFFVDFELDFYCLFSLQNLINRQKSSLSNKIFRTRYFKKQVEMDRAIG